MRVDINFWVKKACKKYNLKAYFLPKNCVYVLHLNGRAVMNFKEDHFYDIHPSYRMKMLLPLVKVGLLHNLGEKHGDKIYGRYQHGIPIVK